MSKKISFFSKYSYWGASSRYRIYNYIPFYEDAGIKTDLHPLLDTFYSKKGKAKFVKIIWAYIHRFFLLLRKNKSELIYIQAELFPYIPYWIEYLLLKRFNNYILDYDDAIFHNYDLHNSGFIRFLFKNKIPHLMKRASYVITGCEYLKNFTIQYNKNVVEIPTSIDWDKYQSVPQNTDRQKFIVGWIGSSSTSEYLLPYIEAFEKFSRTFNAKFYLVGFDKKYIKLFQNVDYKVLNWKEEDEISLLQSFTVGIMPLINTPFANGKCAFKLIQYMACGLPTISTPLLSNLNVNKESNNLFANTVDDWFLALKEIFENLNYYKFVGNKNKNIVAENFTIQKNYIKYIDIFDNFFNL